jgi:hypothetical protein
MVGKDLVRTSIGMSLIETYANWICLNWIVSWMKWYWVFACLFQECYLGLVVNVIAFWLPKYIVVRCICGKLISWSNCRS